MTEITTVLAASLAALCAITDAKVYADLLRRCEIAPAVIECRELTELAREIGGDEPELRAALSRSKACAAGYTTFELLLSNALTLELIELQRPAEWLQHINR
jgi:hypothetical protein